MANLSTSIRVYPDTEMFAIDMAEALDAAMARDGVIQGCAISCSSDTGVLSITSGRIMIHGRIGVVTAGNFTLPTSLSSETQCKVAAVCNLTASSNPFTVAVYTPDDFETIEGNASSNMNADNGIGYVILGTVTVNPSTGKASNWTAATGATAMKGLDAINEIIADALTWKRITGPESGGWGRGRTGVSIPAEAKEIFVQVFVTWTTSGRNAIPFHIPVNDSLFPSSGTPYYIENTYPSVSDGWVRLQTYSTGGYKYVRINYAYKETEDVSNTAYFEVYYR